ncbi:MAG: TIM barrel protein [Phycisphaera sp.]|nr:TIM barrel protein [Phycisphaera sp.]
MIKSISYWSVKGGESCPIPDAIAQAKNAGFAGIELCIGKSAVITPTTSQADCEAIRKQNDAAGLVVQTLASGMSWGLNPVSDDGAIRQQAIEAHAAALQRAAWLGCKALLFVPGVVKSPIAKDVVRYDHALARAAEAVHRLLETADRVGVDLCIENVWNGFLYSPVELAHFIDQFKSKHVGVYFDVGNGLGVHQHPPHTIEILAHRIKRVHIKDFQLVFNTPGSFSFCDLLAGQVPWPEVMSALRAIGYDSTIVAEMMPHDPALLARTSAAMDHILAM